MARRHTSASKDVSVDIDAALDAMDAETLRELIRDLLIEFDDRAHSRILDEITARAARSQSEWAPDALPSSTVAAILSFAESAARVGYAEPFEVDEYLRQGIHAFLARDYRSAFRVFGALLPPLGDAEIYLSQHEMLDEVLSVDTAACTAMYVVASYMSVDHVQRADAVWTAIEDVHALGIFLQPLREMERVAVESLPQFDDFLHRWRALIEERRGEPESEWDTEEDRWLREVIERTEGADGLAELARASKRANDLRAWCHALTAVNDWEAAFAAYKEAADTITSNALARAGFLDGIALAAQMLERNDLHQHLERAWREVPTLLRLRRWLGSAKSGAVLRKRAQQALEGCSKKAVRQLALLHIILGDFDSAAALLADAPGLGWSDAEHPGHLLFPLFQQLLSGVEQPIPGEFEFVSSSEWDVDQLDWMTDDQDEPQLDTPGVNEILQLGSIGSAVTGEVRTTMLSAMRKAAEKRVAGVLEKKRRRHYGHAAQLVGICASLDVAGETASWATRYPKRVSPLPGLSERACGSPWPYAMSK